MPTRFCKEFTRMADEYQGILCVGDPHLCSRVPGFRKDDYPRRTLRKLQWCLEYACAQALLPILLGDLFHYPRDNANWLIVELLRLFDRDILAVVGNHDCNDNGLAADDSLSVLLAAGRMRLLGPAIWQGRIAGRRVAVGGTHWGQPLPKAVEPSDLGDASFVLWVAHHDVNFPGYEQSARIGCREIPGVDLVVNGHVHRCLEDVVCGSTVWCNPGNISRVNRGDGTLRHVPGVLHIEFAEGGWSRKRVEVPHEPFDEVFHAEVVGDPVAVGNSLFIAGLAALQQGRTSGGEGLRAFLETNLEQFSSERVRREILALAEEVLNHAAET